jgi:serine/threonine protein kinase
MSIPTREETLFHDALAQPYRDREAFLLRACAGDSALRGRVEALLAAYDGAPTHLNRAPVLAAAELNAEKKPGDRIGRYKLLQKIGEGGCGIVWMAEQEEPVRRRVALKVIKLGMDTKEVVARFEAERQALALMDHPNIARVFDAGATDTGRPYFVMELVHGVPITKFCDEHNLAMPARLELFTQVCHAVQHAHQKGIIHRDLKPSNILVTLHDGVPVPKVIDFGIAKATLGRLTDQTLFTAFEQFIGTPAYMSPEQAEMSGLDIDTRSDIYSLGVLLYELLTGRPPFDPKSFLQAGLDEMRRIIREVEPPRPSTRLGTLTAADRSTVAKLRGTVSTQLSTVLSGDLDWIVMKALEKNRVRRYETADAFAADIQRHLVNEPVVARPPSKLYVLQKLIRRHRVACTAGAVIVVALVAGLVTTGWAYVNEREARRQALDAERLRQNEVESVITVRNSNARLHRESVANARKAEIESTKTGYALPLLSELIAATAASEGAENASRRARIDALAARLEQDTKIPKAARHTLTELFGDFYAAANDLPQAEALYQQTLTLRREVLGEAHSLTAAAAKKLRDVQARQGKQAAATQTQQDREAKLKTYLTSARWTYQLRERSHRQQSAGNWAAAETSLAEAIAVTRTILGPLYDPRRDLGEMARIKFAAGDFSAAEQLASELVEAERTGRQWSRSGPTGIASRVNPLSPDDDVPYDAYTLLGLVALQRGDARGAREYLLKSVLGFRPENEWMLVYCGAGETWERRDIELAAALLAAGDNATVIKFLGQLRNRAAALESRVFSFAQVAYTWEAPLTLAASGRALVLKFEEWRREVLAGKTPADWQKLLEITPQQEIATRGMATSLEVRTRQAPRALPSTPRSLLPVFVLALGWCTTAAATRFHPRWTLPPAPSRWLVAFCLIRTAECAMFTAGLLVDGFSPPFFLRVAMPLASWLLLWEFVGSLLPDKTSPREKVVVRLAAATAIMGYGGFEFVFLLADQNAAMVAVAVLSMFAILGAGLMVIVAPIVAGRRVWAWSQGSEVRGPRQLVLKFAAVLLAVHSLAAVTLPVLCDQVGGSVAVTALWLNALLPWLLLVGFTDFTAHRQAASVTAA